MAIYLLLRNERVRHVIDTITTPVLFDFDKPASKDLTGTVQTLANMARFVIADYH